MSAGLEERDEMFSAAVTPWHGLGKVVEKALKTEDAIKQAGLDFELVMEPAFAGGGSRGFRKVPGAQVVTIKQRGRKVGDPLAVVGMQYQPIQPRRAFTFMDRVFKDKGARFETGGTLNNQRRMWLLARVPGDITVGRGSKQDVTQRFLLLSTAHDGTGLCQVLPTTVRVVCQNTLSLALTGEKEFNVAIRHSGNVEAKLVQGEQLMGLCLTRFDTYQDTARKLDQVNGEPLFVDYMDAMFPNKYNKDGDKSLSGAAIAEAMAQVYEDEEGKLVVGKDVPDFSKGLRVLEKQESIVQTAQRRNAIAGIRTFFDGEKNKSAWGLFNSATAWVNHGRTLRVGQGGSEQEKRMQTLLFGDGAKVMERAYESIQEVAGVRARA